MSKWNEQKIASEIKLIIEKTNKFPSAKDLQNSGRWDLFRAIANHGGFSYFRNLFDANITPRNYWKLNYRAKIQEMVDTLGRFPSPKEIKSTSIGLFDFLHRTKLLKPLQCEYGYQSAIKPAGYWNDFQNLRCWLLDHFGEMIDSGDFPTTNMICAVKGGRCIVNDVVRKHGGMRKVTHLMGCKPRCLISPDGHYLDSKLELIVDWYLWSRDISHEVHNLIAPSKSRYKCDFKLENNCYIEVWGMMGHKNYNDTRIKKEKLYDSLGYTLISIEKDFFNKTFFEIEATLDEIFARYNLNTVQAKNKYRLEEICPKGRNYWTFENTVQELKLVITNINKFPSVSYLRQIGKYQIQKSMQKYGGQNVFRSLLGFELYNRKK